MTTVTATLPAPIDSLITEYLEYLDGRRSVNTIDHYAEILARMDRELPAGLPSAHADEIKHWIDDGDRQKITRKHYRSIANGFFVWATDAMDQRLDFNPVGAVESIRVRRRHPRPVTTEEVFQILAPAAAPYRLWYLIAAVAGLPCNELAGLERKHITRDDIWVCGKGDVER